MYFVVAYAYSGLSPVRARPWRANKEKTDLNIMIGLNGEMNTRVGLVWKRRRYITKGMAEFLDFCKKYYVEKGK